MKAFKRYPQPLSDSSSKDSAVTVAIALIVNIFVAIAKTVAALITHSASVGAEAVHSWVELGNEFFVVFAARSASRPADPDHPLGYGRESYVWSLFASIGMLIIGAVVGIGQGVYQLALHQKAEDFLVGYIVLAVSFALETVSFVKTYRQMRKGADSLGRDIFEHAFLTSNSTIRTLFTEGVTSLVTLVIAAAGVSLHQITGNPTYDATGSITIGAVLAVAALMLISRNRRFLEGRSVAPSVHANALKTIEDLPEIAGVHYLYSEFIGPERLLLIAGVSIAGEHTQTELAGILRELEKRIMERRFIGMAVLTLATPDHDGMGTGS